LSTFTHIFIACITHIACYIDIWTVTAYKHAMMRDPIYKHIGAVIKARRRTLGLKQETLAGKLGISRGSLANIETGRQNVLVHQLFKIAAALELTPMDLLPPPSTEHVRAGRTELPLPENLKAQQKEQIARLFEGVDTDQTRAKERSRAKTSKH
jgi:transcriptional regulator with XRE-family HTH domain